MLRNCVSLARGHMLDATPVMGWVGPKIFRGVSNVAGTQTLDRSWQLLKIFLPHHMVLKHKDRGHSTMHPSVSQYVFMWCWRCSLDSPDPQRFLEELERLERLL